jgi:hypothetical protein
MTEKRQTSQGYIIRILQHFATKRRNITNFVMLFQAVVKVLSRSKFCSLGNRSILSLLHVIQSITFPCRKQTIADRIDNLHVVRLIFDLGKEK